MPTTIRLLSVNDFAEWRNRARGLLLAGVPPEQVIWADPAQPADLFSTRDSGTETVTARKAGVVPPRFLRLAEAALCHRDPLRFELLYSLLWRLQKDRTILFNLDDTDVTRLNRRVEAVVVEIKRMKMELRFRRSVAADGHKGLAAWFEPNHYVLERVAPYFAREIAHEDWVIATPYRSAFWDRKELAFADPRPSHAVRRA
jgi:probable DNA metabolism protein